MEFERSCADRRVPEISPVGDRIRVVIDSDAKCEMDDQWAITLALLADDRFAIEGFVGASFDSAEYGRSSIDASVDEINHLIGLTESDPSIPVRRGAPPLQYPTEPSASAGVDFIIERALAGEADDPLWVIGLGAATDVASAIMQDERIVDRIVVFQHLRTNWPEYCVNYNVYNDVRAAQRLFHSPVPFVLFDTGDHLTCPMEESAAEVAPYGEIGAYLHEYRHRRPYFSRPDKGIFDLGDIAALIDPELATWEVEPCPSIRYDQSYDFDGPDRGRILRCGDIDRDGTFRLFYDRLQDAFPES